MKWMHDEGTRNMLADIERADPFDGGCVADVDHPAHGGPGGTMGDAAAALPVTRSETLMESSYRSGRERGIVDATMWLRAHGYGEAASALIRAETEISSRF